MSIPNLSSTVLISTPINLKVDRSLDTATVRTTYIPVRDLAIVGVSTFKYRPVNTGGGLTVEDKRFVGISRVEAPQMFIWH